MMRDWTEQWAANKQAQQVWGHSGGESWHCTSGGGRCGGGGRWGGDKREWKSKLTWFDISIIAIFSWEKCRDRWEITGKKVVMWANYKWQLGTEGRQISLEGTLIAKTKTWGLKATWAKQWEIKHDSVTYVIFGHVFSKHQVIISVWRQSPAEYEHFYVSTSKDV